MVGALAVEAERREAEALRAVGHERVDHGRLAGVLDEADDGERAARREPAMMSYRAPTAAASVASGVGGPAPVIACLAARGGRAGGGARRRAVVAVADLLEVGEDRVAREIERLGDLLGGALDEERAALLEALDDLHLLLARHGGGRLAHLVRGPCVTMPATTSRMSPAKISPASGAASLPRRPTAVKLASVRCACTTSEMS